MAFLSTRALLVLGVSMAVALHCAAAASYTVGGATGWTVPAGNSFYTSWAANSTFKVGDSLVFNYATNAHNVVRVSQANYNSCSTSGALATYTTGPTTVNLTDAGPHYYICGVPGHCTAGQKLAITVSAATASPSPSPTPSSSPSPSPSTSPSPSQPPSTSTPKAAPTPAPTSSAVTPVQSPTGSAASPPSSTPTNSPSAQTPATGTSNSPTGSTSNSPTGSTTGNSSDASYHSISPLAAWMSMLFAAAAGFFVL